MIPILYEKTETEFVTNGLGRLSDAVRCVVSEERNSIYELELDYPVSGRHFDKITIGRIIAATHDDTDDIQPFDIYHKTEPIGGIVTFYAHHISYRLNEITVSPFTADSCAAALQQLGTNSVGTNRFTFTTDKVVDADYTVAVPSTLRSLLAGQAGSILDVYGKGEYLFDKWNVSLLTNRGRDRNVTIRYGKNLIEFNNDYNAQDVYTAVYPYWKGTVYPDTEGAEPLDVLVTLTEKTIASGYAVESGREIIVPMDLSGDFSEEPTEAELRAKATERLAASGAWLAKQTVRVDFVQLWQTEEYKNYAPLQTVSLCDWVTIVVPMYNFKGSVQVIKTTYNTLLGRYDSIELGDPPQGFAATIINTAVDEANSYTDTAVYAPTITANYAKKIADNTNQYFWHAETGEDTGAHITEVPQEEWLDEDSENYHSGGNLLARTNGIAVRDGLTELATFGADQARVGALDSGHTIVSANGLDVYGGDGTQEIAHIGYGTVTGTSGRESQGTFYTLGERKADTAIGVGSFAEGKDNAALAAYTHAEGYGTTAGEVTMIQPPRGAHAEGHSTTSTGIGSHAEGFGTNAGGNYSHAGGENTIAKARALTAIGRNNVEGSGAKGAYGDWVFVVGNGTGNSNRSNALVLEWDGDLRIAGDLYTGCGTDSTGGNIHGKLNDLAEGTDIMALELGTYYARNNAVAATLVNCPTPYQCRVEVFERVPTRKCWFVYDLYGNVFTRSQTSATGYTTWANISGTTLGVDINNTDLNTVTNFGRYSASSFTSLTNAPNVSGGTSMDLYVLPRSSNSRTWQIALIYKANENSIWFRSNIGADTWSDWLKIVTAIA